MRPMIRTSPRSASSAVLALLLFAAALLTACPAPTVTDARPGELDELPQDGNLSLSLRAIVVDKKTHKEHLMTENESLYSGDGIYFLLRTSQPAYVYVVLFDSADKAETLFPAAPGGERKIGGRCPALRIPSQGTFDFQLPAGRRDLRAVASSVPLAQADRRMCAQLQLPCQEPAKARAMEPECPGNRQRSFFAAVKVANATPSGVASLRLTLNHDQ